MKSRWVYANVINVFHILMYGNNVEIRMTPYAFLVYCYKSIKISCDIYAYIYNKC